MSANSTEQWVRAGWLIDGQGGPKRMDALIHVRDDTVLSIQTFSQGQTVTLDLSQATVLPALMDAHVHLAFSSRGGPRRCRGRSRISPDQVRTTILRRLSQYWECGVAAVRDGGDRNGDLLACRQQGFLAAAPPVTVACSGWAWHAPGRYGAMIGRAAADGRSMVAAMEEGLQEIDHLKLLQSGINSLDRFGFQGGPQFSSEDLGATVKVAHAAGKPVMVHANGERAVRMAIDAGCDSIEHGYFMGPDNLARMAAKGIAWVPTVVPMAVLAKASGISPAQRDTAGRTLEHQLAQIGRAHGLGVSIALGTDAGSPGVAHGHSVRRELEWFMAAGMSIEAAVRSAGLNAARLMGLAGRGALRPGWRADFIVVPGPPDDLPASMAAIHAICIAGRWASPITL